jgi:hypothetical protein
MAKKRKKVEIVFVLDETGSMETIEKDAVGGYNNFVKEQRALPADISFSLILFSKTGGEEVIRPKYEGVALADVKDLAQDDYKPRGMTPLLDAVGHTIDSVEKRIGDMPKKKRPQVIVAIMTDGLENASVEYTKAQIKEKVENSGWDFIFLGANMDAFAEGSRMGMGDFTFTYDASSRGVADVYTRTSATVSHLVGNQ